MNEQELRAALDALKVARQEMIDQCSGYSDAMSEDEQAPQWAWVDRLDGMADAIERACPGKRCQYNLLQEKYELVDKVMEA